MSDDHHRVSPAGKVLGKWTSGIDAIGRKALEAPDLRCATCAFRAGTVPNGCLQTQLDIVKALHEGVPFGCHAPRDGKLCNGFIAARLVVATVPMPKELIEMADRWTFTTPDAD